MRKERVSALALPLVLAACGGDGERAGDKRAEPPSARAPASVGGPIHGVDWGSVTIPGSVCGAKEPIVLRRPNWGSATSPRLGHAVVESRRWPHYRRVGVDTGWNPVVYGDLDRDGEDEAALVAGCNNRGGTADGFLAYAQVIFDFADGRPRVLKVVTPQERPRPHQLPTLLTVRIVPGKVVAREAWYGPRDGTCCPTGRSVTTWRLEDDQLFPRRTVVTRRPRGLRT